ncbi:tetratricopeptide repeat protein [Candidatus Thioglobus sp.]|uniref:tetratricopeptide repeat protein n=1 Tax=Candidatus Thioglobus sp. TaxID=2026721 RepID=UPI003D09625C
MIKFFYLVAIIFLPAQALQILQLEGGNEVVKHQSQVLKESSQLSSDLLLTKLEKLAKSGDARSQFSLANIYHNGIGTKINETLAFYWYTQVAKQGFASAQFNVANGYYHGIGTRQNFKQALSWYEKAAEQDFVSAQYNLAVMYRRGEGAKVDNKAAFHWYEQAAQLGYGLAQLTLAKLYEKGVGVKQSDALAQTWYLRAANQLDPEAQFHLAQFHQQRNNYSQAVFYYRKAADQGHSYAQFALAMNLLEGRGVIKDENKAQQLFLAAAEAGHIKAQFQLGRLLMNNDQISEARIWLSKASDQALDSAAQLLKDLDAIEHSKQEALKLKLVTSDLPAPVVETKHNKKSAAKAAAAKIFVIETKHNKNLAAKAAAADITLAIARGLKTQLAPNFSTLIPNQQQILASLNKNAKLMHDAEQLQLSAAQGNPISQYRLSKLYSAGALTTKNQRKAFLLMQQSAKQGVARSQNALSMMYINGIGVEKNYQKAYYWASISAQKGNVEAKQTLLYLASRSF